MSEREVFGKCPICGGDIIDKNKAWGCAKWKESDGGCKFTIWKNIANRDITVDEMKSLLTDKKTDYLDGFVSKKGNSFSARLCLNDGKIELEFKPRT